MRFAPLAFALLCARPIGAQQIANASVPAAVRQGLMSKYPGIEKAAWTLAGADYVGVFRTSGAEVSAAFSPAGQWIESATQVGAITLPDTVKKLIIRAYKGYQFTDVRRLDRATKPAILFEVHLDKPGEAVTVVFEPNGSIFTGGTHATSAGGRGTGH